MCLHQEVRSNKSGGTTDAGTSDGARLAVSFRPGSATLENLTPGIRERHEPDHPCALRASGLPAGDRLRRACRGKRTEPTSPVRRPRAVRATRTGLVEEITVLGPARLPESRTSADGLTVQVIDAREIRASGARHAPGGPAADPGIHLADEQGNIRQKTFPCAGSPRAGHRRAAGISVFVDGVRVNEPAAEEVAFELIPLGTSSASRSCVGRTRSSAATRSVERSISSRARGGREPEASVQIEGGSWKYQEARGSFPVRSPVERISFPERILRPGLAVRGAGHGVRAFGKLGASQEGASATLSYQFQVDRLQQPAPSRRRPWAPIGGRTTRRATSSRLVSLRHAQWAGATRIRLVRRRERLLPLGRRGAVQRELDQPDTRCSTVPQRRRDAATRSPHACGRAAEPAQRRGGGHAQRRAAAGHEEANPRFTTSEDGKPLPRLTSDLYDRQWAWARSCRNRPRSPTDLSPDWRHGCVALRPDCPRHRDTSPDAPGNATGNAIFSAWIPAAGISWAIAPHWLVSTSWTAGFRAPAFLELTCADPAAPASVCKPALRRTRRSRPFVRPLSIARGGRQRVTIRWPHRHPHCIPRRSTRRYLQRGRSRNDAGVLPERGRDAKDGA